MSAWKLVVLLGYAVMTASLGVAWFYPNDDLMKAWYRSIGTIIVGAVIAVIGLTVMGPY